MDQNEANLTARHMFVSYSSRDANAATAVVAVLEAHEIACWIAPRDIPPGTRYGEAIIDGINDCSLLVLLLSQHSNESAQVLAEVERAVSKGRPIVTVRLEAVALTKSLEYFLSSFHWFDAFPPPLNAHLERLVETVERRGGTGATPPTVSASAPPPRSTANNLPQQLTSFIGRERELDEITRLLPKTRLLTLTGAGGAGKTRLSLRVASELLTGDGDGVWLIELAPLSDPALVPQAVADVFGIRENTEETLMKTLLVYLKEKRLLLILDNCEHVSVACASLAAELLRSCPGVHLLASSREPLGVPGEQVYRVPSLSLPDPKSVQTAEMLPQYEAARLMIERAQAVRPDFLATDQNAAAIAQICHRLDGIPLALELAAARVRSLSVEEVNSRLDNRFRLLTGGSKTLLPRQQTLRGLIDWSYDLLTEQERLLLQRLSVFAGGWTLSATGTVGAGDEIEDWEVLDLLTSLVDKSLVIAETEDASTRYRFQESIRQYALEHLQENGDADTVRARHAAWCLSLAEEASPNLTGPAAKTWMARLETEHDNVRAALTFYLEDRDAAAQTRAPEMMWRLVAAMGNFWYPRGYLSEGRRWVERVQAGGTAAVDLTHRFAVLRWGGVFAAIQCDYVVARASSEAALMLAQEMGDKKKIGKMLGDLGTFAFLQGDFTKAQMLYDQSLEICREAGDRGGVATMLTNSGLAASKFDNYEVAEARHHEALELFREDGNKRAMAFALNGLANIRQNQGDIADAYELYEQTRDLFEEIGDKRELTMSIGNTGTMAYWLGDYATAKSRLEAALPTMRELGDQRNTAVFFLSLGQTLMLLGDLADARAALHEGLGIVSAPGMEQSLPELLRGYAELAAAEGDPERAARLHGGADALGAATNEHLAPFFAAEKERVVSNVRVALGEEEFATAYAAGQAMTREQIVELARMQG